MPFTDFCIPESTFIDLRMVCVLCMEREREREWESEREREGEREK